MKRLLILAVMTSIGVAGPAVAGSIKDGTWAPNGCGAEPTPMDVDLSSRTAYRNSEGPVSTYVADAQKYFECAVDEAHADMVAIKQAMDTKRAAVKVEFDKISADSHSAAAKFSGSELSDEELKAITEAPPTSQVPAQKNQTTIGTTTSQRH
jgi:hypothetical protein